ncbi:hypothetical protein [Edaphobacter sp.]|uniref:hypothetical protein n=1 Tax=Edaphobacter sp. TaxID=1934404 RepID=UPI002DB69C97|nr:hypothetical protein [Edaphobacter sp.]HEU5340512.1 hypothetical protein [Edaphobacter sp.]
MSADEKQALTLRGRMTISGFLGAVEEQIPSTSLGVRNGNFKKLRNENANGSGMPMEQSVVIRVNPWSNPSL